MNPEMEKSCWSRLKKKDYSAQIQHKRLLPYTWPLIDINYQYGIICQRGFDLLFQLKLLSLVGNTSY